MNEAKRLFTSSLLSLGLGRVCNWCHSS